MTIDKKELYDAWLSLETQMLKRHGDERWAFVGQGMKGAFFMGAMAALMSPEPFDELMAQANSGISEAMGMRNAKIVDSKSGAPVTEAVARANKSTVAALSSPPQTP